MKIMATRWILLVLLLHLPAQADLLEQAEVHYEQSRAPGLSPEQRSGWLKKSLEVHPTFKAHYELGKLQRQARSHEAALESFQAAFRLTDDDKYLAQAAYQTGVTWYRMERFVEARQWLRRSLGFQDHPEVRRSLRELELSRKGTVLSADEILRELRVTRSFQVAQVELRVNFEINEATLDEIGRRQARELGLALTDPAGPRGTVVLLGHTDRQCPRARPDDVGCDLFNLDLSGHRAIAVRHYLRTRFHLSGVRVRTLACGRGYPLSRQASPDDHYLNRRVVVLVAGEKEFDRDELCGSAAGLL